MRWVLVVIAFTLGACRTGSPNGPAGPLDLRVVLAPGQQATVPGAGSVRFEGVANDSRCPGDAICVWAGDAIVRIQATSSGSDTSSFELHTVDLKPVQFRGASIAL